MSITGIKIGSEVESPGRAVVVCVSNGMLPDNTTSVEAEIPLGALASGLSNRNGKDRDDTTVAAHK